MTEVYLGLGSNVGDREQNLKQAVKLINDFAQTKVVNLSTVYITEPWGYTDQRQFLNLCLLLATELGPQDLLANCQQVEKKLDRTREVRWGPRTIDVDILIYQGLNLNEAELTLPHPRLTERAFVLIPLIELNSSLVVNGRQLTSWLSELDTIGVKKYARWELKTII